MINSTSRTQKHRAVSYLPAQRATQFSPARKCRVQSQYNQSPLVGRHKPRLRRSFLLTGLLLSLYVASSVFASPLTDTKPTSDSQQLVKNETDPSSPRHTKLEGTDTSSAQVLRFDVDKDGDPDVLERWWNGKRARWFDENDDMNQTDVQGDTSDDAVQIDRDGDAYYDGPGDMNVDWVDDDDDGDADVQAIAMNPAIYQKKITSYQSHWMLFVDVDDDNVHGYIDWQTFDFPCWRFTDDTNFSPDYNGDSVFLKEHAAPLSIQNPSFNWENPFAFYDVDNDGVTEMAIRHCDQKVKLPGGDETGFKYDGDLEEAYVSYDLDNDAVRGNEMDFDLTLKFGAGEKLNYSTFREPHPKLKAPDWVLPYFRYDNWRKLDELVYVPHDKCYDETFKAKWGYAFLTFDEDDDDHRWERVELYYPHHHYTTKGPRADVYSTARWAKDEGTTFGLPGHGQSDTLGDRGEYDLDNSGKGQLYVGRDGRIHLHGAEWGAWTVDYGAKYWGSSPVTGGSSPDKATSVPQAVHYADTDNNGFLDEINYDYNGDRTIDLRINLKELLDGGDKPGDVADLINPADEKWQGMHELFTKISEKSWQDALLVYQAVWKKGLVDPEMHDLAIASSTAEKYEKAFWLKEKVFRKLDAKLAAKPDLAPAQQKLRKAYFGGDAKAYATFIGEQSW